MWDYKIKQFKIFQGNNTTWHLSPSNNQYPDTSHVLGVLEIWEAISLLLTFFHYARYTYIMRIAALRIIDPPRYLLKSELD